MAGKPKKAKSAKCDPLREQIALVVKEIGDVRRDLTDPKITAKQKVRLRALLKKLIAQRTLLERALEKCEEISSDPLLQ